VEHAKDIDESPGDGLLVGVSCVDVKIGIVHAPFRMVDVNRPRGDIEISNPDGRLNEDSKRFRNKPAGVETRRACKRISLKKWNSPEDVGVDDGNTADDGLDGFGNLRCYPLHAVGERLFPEAFGSA
jgi:hypothetical protein